ncbi:MAG: hypothetical protein US25_C0014G0008 [Candidatus Moranbacteria bacterium GW2011_GWE1_36_7]|nr:MAG: hypothetical protein UR99_C0054G0007 [Candidatus Moranbacteria bacterium GW2011_GWD2_36_12]KKQ06510.1 MAG: hypothetical protein US16_C0015G0007 [Candidatus Moranbacteria bacterium GW2011_GWE2_36_40]KKQ15080.1 MAG: hypothetical protein US25_C0014G0008 [Candidatus Moranbacteria bacterium GW2011_GWE1_36_7]
MSEKFEYYPTPEKQKEFKEIQNENPIEAEEIIESAQEEGNIFNDLLKRDKIDAQFLSKVITREQTPENVYEVFERVISKIQDIRRDGSISHASHKALPDDVLPNGLKSRTRLQREGKFKGGYCHDTVFRHHVSCASRNHCGGEFNYYLDNEFLKHIFRNDSSFFDQIRTDLDGKPPREKELIKFVGEYFHKNGYSHTQGSMIEKMLDEAERLGWITEARINFEETKKWHEKKGHFEKTGDPYIDKIKEIKVFDRECFAYAYMRPLENRFYHNAFGNNSKPHDGEIVIDFDNINLNNFQGNPIAGVAIENEQMDVIKNINKLSVNEIKNAVPIYNTQGDLIWPIKMKYSEIKKYIETKNINIEQKVEIEAMLDEMAEFVYENQKKATAIEMRKKLINENDGKPIDEYLLKLDAPTDDNFWLRENKCYGIDVEIVSFDNLPDDWKEEVLSSANDALSVVFEGANLGKKFDETFIEEAAIKYQYMLSIKHHIDPFVVDRIDHGNLYDEYFKLDDFFMEQRKTVIKKAIDVYERLYAKTS